MAFICELDPYSLEIYRMCKNELPIRQGCRKLSYACEWMHLVRRGHFLYVTKDGGHTIRSAIPENSMYTRKLLICYRTGVMDDRSSHCGNRNFLPVFAPVTLTLTRIHTRVNAFSLETQRMCKYEVLTSRLSKVTV